jgi:putative membrane protein
LPVPVYAFLLGLILASVLAAGATVRGWNGWVLLSLLAGTVAAFMISGAVPVQASRDPLTLFMSGALAICAMILPGISGTFILLILDQHGFVLNAVTQFDIFSLAIADAGCVAVLVLFSRVPGWLLRRAPDVMTSALIGFMIGSLRKSRLSGSGRARPLAHRCKSGFPACRAFSGQQCKPGSRVNVVIRASL